MPQPRYLKAITTKASITSLWAAAEIHGEITVRLADKRACYAFRNKLYAHRSALRKAAHAHVGVEASNLDGFKISYREELEWREVEGSLNSAERPTGKWLLTIAYEELVEFELLIPDDWVGDIPHLDTTLEDEWAAGPSDLIDPVPPPTPPADLRGSHPGYDDEIPF